MKRNLSSFNYMLDSYDSNDEVLNELRKSFVNRFDRKTIANMSLGEYVIGTGSHTSFCYLLERGLRSLGSFLGANASKFGIYYSQEDHDYIIAKKWDKGSKQATLKAIKNAILQLLDDGYIKNFSSIENNSLSPTFKLKLLSIYYPEKYLNIFSVDHLNFFLYQFYGNSNSYDYNKSDLEKQQDLIKLKKNDTVTKGWNNIKFGNYLYHLFPSAPEIAKNKSFNEYRQLTPTNDKKTHQQAAIVSTMGMSKVRGRIKHRLINNVGRIDYVQHEKKVVAIGDLGEKIVMDNEMARLADKHPDLAKQVLRVSLLSDKYGYDIKSFEEDGSPRYIEVKSTNEPYKEQFSFYLTENERQHAESLENYWLYRVFSVDSVPRIVRIKNPFGDKQKMSRLVPTQYQATIRLK